MLANGNKKVNGPWDRSIGSEKIRNLASGICMDFMNDGNVIAENVRLLIINHMKKFENTTSPSSADIIKFLNKNKNFMTCGEEDKHYMKESFDHGRAYDQLFNVLFFEELLTDDESLWVDINAISLNENGKPETVLDYMYIQIADMTNTEQVRNEIKSLIETFEQYLGGKRFVDLPKAEQQKWLEYSREQKTSN